MDLAHWIERHAAFTPDKPAIFFAEKDISYAALAIEVHRATDWQPLKLSEMVGHASVQVSVCPVADVTRTATVSPAVRPARAGKIAVL